MSIGIGERGLHRPVGARDPLLGCDHEAICVASPPSTTRVTVCPEPPFRVWDDGIVLVGAESSHAGQSVERADQPLYIGLRGQADRQGLPLPQLAVGLHRLPWRSRSKIGRRLPPKLRGRDGPRPFRVSTAPAVSAIAPMVVQVPVTVI